MTTLKIDYAHWTFTLTDEEGDEVLLRTASGDLLRPADIAIADRGEGLEEWLADRVNEAPMTALDVVGSGERENGKGISHEQFMLIVRFDEQAKCATT